MEQNNDLYVIFVVVTVLAIVSYFFYSTNKKINEIKEILSQKDNVEYNSEELQNKIKEELENNEESNVETSHKLETIGENDSSE